MASDQVEGIIKNGVGHLQDGAGGLTGDHELQAKGKLNEVAGFVQDKIGDLKDQARDGFGQAQDQAGKFLTRATSRYDDIEHMVSENPLIAVGIATVVGIGVGLALRGRTTQAVR
jgi:uncharacterized protein YjbJ (UPF0337 family)